MADSIVDMIIAVPGFGNVRCKLDTVLKVLRQTGVSGFDILCSTVFVQYAVVRILAVIRAQSLQKSAMESLRKELQNFTQAGFNEDSSFQTSWETQTQLSTIHNCCSGVFLGMTSCKKLSDRENHVCLRQGV